MSRTSIVGELAAGLSPLTGRALQHDLGPPRSLGAMIAWGTGTIANGTQFHAPGALYQRTDGGVGTALYKNTGNEVASIYAAVSVA